RVPLPLAVEVGDLLLQPLVLAAVLDERRVVGVAVRLGEPGLDGAEPLLGRRDLALEPAGLAGRPLRRPPGRPVRRGRLPFLCRRRRDLRLRRRRLRRFLLARPGGLGGARVVAERALAGDETAVLDRERSRRQRLDQRAVVRHQEERAREAQQGVLERLAALDVQVVGGLVQDEEVRARDDGARERQSPPLAAGERRHGLLDVLAREEEEPEQVARGWAGQAGAGRDRVEGAVGVRQLERLLRVVAGLGAVAEPDLAGGGLAAAEQRLEQGRLARAVRPDQGDPLPALDGEVGALDERAPGD